MRQQTATKRSNLTQKPAASPATRTSSSNKTLETNMHSWKALHINMQRSSRTTPLGQILDSGNSLYRSLKAIKPPRPNGIIQSRSMKMAARKATPITLRSQHETESHRSRFQTALHSTVRVIKPPLERHPHPVLKAAMKTFPCTPHNG